MEAHLAAASPRRASIFVAARSADGTADPLLLRSAPTKEAAAVDTPPRTPRGASNDCYNLLVERFLEGSRGRTLKYNFFNTEKFLKREKLFTGENPSLRG